MKLDILVLFGALVTAGSVVSDTVDSPLCKTLAETPRSVTVSIARTGSAVDGGSILNELRFSDGRVYVLSLDFPFDLMSDKLIHSELHFTIFVPGKEPPDLETLEHDSPAERRLLELLESVVTTTKNPHEKKNASSLITFLRNRHQAFPRAHGGKWDLTPWSTK